MKNNRPYTDAEINQMSLDELRSRFTLAQMQALAARIEIERRDGQIAAMAEEIERLRREIAAWESDDWDRLEDEADLQAELERLRGGLKDDR